MFASGIATKIVEKNPSEHPAAGKIQMSPVPVAAQGSQEAVEAS
jgi:hypothetical protein